MKLSRSPLDDMPVALRSLTAYTALAALTLAIISVVSADLTHTAFALGLAADALLLSWRSRSAWWLQVAGCLALLVASVMGQGTLVVAETMTLLVLALPSTRLFYGVTEPLPA
jgi:hypothetical protein